MQRPKWFVNLPWVKAYLARLRDPILADRSLDLMSAAFWFFLSVWGIASCLTGLGTITESIGDAGRIIWGGCVGVLCSGAFAASMSTFLTQPNLLARIRRKKIEMLFGSLAGGFISVYPAFLAAAWIFQGDFTRFAPMWAALVYLVIPTWRVRHLYHRISSLRQIALDTGHIPRQVPRISP